MRSTAWRGEEIYVPKTFEQAVALRRELIDAGVPAGTASSIVGWLGEKDREGLDRTAPNQRSRYRKILDEVFGGKPPIMYRPSCRAA